MPVNAFNGQFPFRFVNEFLAQAWDRPEVCVFVLEETWLTFSRIPDNLLFCSYMWDVPYVLNKYIIAPNCIPIHYVCKHEQEFLHSNDPTWWNYKRSVARQVRRFFSEAFATKSPFSTNYLTRYLFFESFTNNYDFLNNYTFRTVAKRICSKVLEDKKRSS